MKKIELTTTNILLAVLSIIFILTTFFSLSKGTLVSTEVLNNFGAEKLDFVLQGQVWRIITSAFLHAGPIHFIVNLYALYSLGNFIENFYGKKKLFVVFLFTSIIGSLASLSSTLIMGLLTRTIVIVPSVGASGGLFGLLGLLLGNKIKNDIYSPQLPIDERSLYMIIIVNLGVGFLFPFINNSAHIGGLVAGILFGLLLKPILSYSESNFEKYSTKLLYWIGISITIASFLLQLLFNY